MLGDRELRRDILKLLYEKFQEHPYHRILASEFCEFTGVSLNRLDYNMIYLEEKGYVELQKPPEGEVFVSARITVKGIDLVEDDFEFDIRLHKDKEDKRTDMDKAFAALNQLKKAVEHTTPRSLTKDDLLAELDELIAELKSENPDYQNVRKQLDFLKKKEPDVTRQLLGILKDPSIIQILSKSIFQLEEE